MKNSFEKIFANTVLTGGIITCFLLILFAIYEITIMPEKTSAYTVYILLCLITIAFLFFIMTRTIELKVNISIVIISLIICSYMIEVFMHFYHKSKSSGAIGQSMAVKTGNKYDKRTKLQVMDDLKKEGINAYASFHGSILAGSNGLKTEKVQIYPLSGISGKTTVLCNEGGEWTIYKADEYGFNNPSGLYKEGEIDIVILGASVIQGSCVKPGDDIAGHLRNKGYNALNMGIGGNGPLMELATFIEYAKPFRPKIVLWSFDMSDLTDLENEMRSDILMNYLEEDFSQDLMHRQKEVEEALKKWLGDQEKIFKRSDHSLLSEIVTFQNSRRTINQLINANSETGFREDYPFDLLEKILSEAKEMISSWNGELYFLYLGHLGHESNAESQFLRDRVLSIAKKLELPVIDSEAVILSYHDPAALVPFGRIKQFHPNAKGYALIAESIKKNLEMDRTRNQKAHVKGSKD